MQSLTSVGYPRNLSYVCRHLSSYSRQNYRLQAVSNDSATASSIITVDLPNNSLVDLSTLIMYFNGSTAANATKFASFPKNICGILDRIECECNGQLISTGCSSINQLYNLLYDIHTSQDFKNKRSVLQNGGDQVVPTANVTNQPFIINNFLGFVGSVSPNIIDTSLLGNVRIRFTLATPAVLIQSEPGIGASYSLSQIMFSVDRIDLDPMFYDIHNRYLQSGQTYEMPFNNWLSFSTTCTGSLVGSTKFSLSTQSLNHLYGMYVYGNQLSTFDTITKNSSFFTRLSDGLTSTQWNVNGLYYPNWLATPAQSFALLTSSMGENYSTVGGLEPNLNSLARWLSSFWVSSMRLDHGGDGVTLVSGVDTRGNTASCYFQSNGGVWNNGTVTTANVMALVFAQTTSSLIVGAGRQISVVL